MTSIDLYDELMKNAPPDLQLDSSRNSRQSEVGKATDQFELKIKDCQRLIIDIRNHNDDIWNLKDRLMNNTRSDKQAQTCELIKTKCDQNFQIIKDLQTNLIAIGKLVEKAKIEFPQQPETFSKIYRRQHLAEEIGTIIKRTEQIQLVVQKFSVDTRLKRIKLVMRDEISDKQALELANKVDGLQQAVMSKMTGKASIKLKYAHSDILSKAQGIAQLEKSVEQNLELMRQGEMINNIYKNVCEARDYVGKAEAVLFKQKQHHKKSRKKMCCIILIGIILLAVVLTPIIIKVVKSKQSQNNNNTTPSNSTDTNTTQIGFND